MKRKKEILNDYLNSNDVVSCSKTIYDVDHWTIVRKNFLAGISRSAGAWFFNLVILAALAYILLPFFGPAIDNFYKNMQERLNNDLPTGINFNLTQGETR